MGAPAIPEKVEAGARIPGDAGEILAMDAGVLLSGTPEGVGPIHAGDVMRASIERIGEMAVHVKAA